VIEARTTVNILPASAACSGCFGKNIRTIITYYINISNGNICVQIYTDIMFRVLCRAVSRWQCDSCLFIYNCPAAGQSGKSILQLQGNVIERLESFHQRGRNRDVPSTVAELERYRTGTVLAVPDVPNDDDDDVMQKSASSYLSWLPFIATPTGHRVINEWNYVIKLFTSNLVIEEN